MNKIIFTCSEHEIDLFSLSIQEKVLRHHFPFQFFEKDVPHVEAMMVALHKVNSSFAKKYFKKCIFQLGKSNSRTVYANVCATKCANCN